MSMYTPTSPIAAFNGVPRYGHTSDLTDLFQSTSSSMNTDTAGSTDIDLELDRNAVDDYIRGILFVAGLLLSLFVLWVVILLIAKCLGRRVGIMAGHPPFAIDEEDDDDKERERQRQRQRQQRAQAQDGDGYGDGQQMMESTSMAATEQSKYSRKRRSSSTSCSGHNKFTIAILISALLIIGAGITFVVRGAMSLENAVEDMDTVSSGLNSLLGRISTTADIAISYGKETKTLSEQLEILIEDKICDATLPFFVEQSDRINESAKDVQLSIAQLADFSIGGLQMVRDSVNDSFQPVNDALMEISEFAQEDMVSYIWYVAIPVLVLGVWLALGAIGTSVRNCKKGAGARDMPGGFCRLYTCVQTWILLPLVFLLIFGGCVAAMLGSLVLTVNSDICLGGETRSPEGIVKALVEKAGTDGVVLEASNYYVINSCAGEFSSIAELDGLIKDLTEGEAEVNELKSLLETDTQNITDVCNNDEARMEEIKQAVTQVSTAFSEFQAIAKSVREIMECEPINDIYIDLHHDLLCTSLPYTFAWAFATMVCVFGLGMFVFLVRGALLSPERSRGMYEGVYSEDHSERNKPLSDDEDMSYQYEPDRNGNENENERQTDGGLYKYDPDGHAGHGTSKKYQYDLDGDVSYGSSHANSRHNNRSNESYGHTQEIDGDGYEITNDEYDRR